MGRVLQRGAVMAMTLLALSVATFVTTEAMPGDAAGVLAGPQATEEERARLHHDLGLDIPWPVRWVGWLSHAVRGELGVSQVSGEPVAVLIGPLLTNTLSVALVAASVTVVLATGLGLAMGSAPAGRLDRMLGGLLGVVVAMPEFLVASLFLGGFAVVLRWFPPTSIVPLGDGAWQHPQILVLPALTLASVTVPVTGRLLRAQVIRVSKLPFVEQARLDGAGPLNLAVVHILPSAAAPALQALSTMVPALLGGAVVVETVFSFPGIGAELVNSVQRQDAPAVQAIVLVLGTLTLVCHVVADALTAALPGRSL